MALAVELLIPRHFNVSHRCSLSPVMNQRIDDLLCNPRADRMIDHPRVLSGCIFSKHGQIITTSLRPNPGIMDDKKWPQVSG
jgi:hypothetical protein